MSNRSAILNLAFGAAIGVVMVAALAGAASAQSAQADLVKRGDYLVNGIMTCGNCHTPKGPPAVIAGKDFSGGLSWDEPPFKVTAPNITPGQGNRHRQLDRCAHQDGAAHGQTAERRARRDDHADRLLSTS